MPSKQNLTYSSISPKKYIENKNNMKFSFNKSKFNEPIIRNAEIYEEPYNNNLKELLNENQYYKDLSNTLKQELITIKHEFENKEKLNIREYDKIKNENKSILDYCEKLKEENENKNETFSKN